MDMCSQVLRLDSVQDLYLDLLQYRNADAAVTCFQAPVPCLLRMCMVATGRLHVWDVYPV